MFHKTVFFYALLALSVISLNVNSGCASPAQTQIDLSVGGSEWKGLVMTAPAGSKAVATPYSLVVQKGETFQIELHTGSAEIISRKSEIKNNQINKLKRFTVDKPDFLLYSTDTGMGEEWHFIISKRIDGAEYYCEDVKGSTYKKEDIEAMAAAAQSLKKK